MMLYVLFCEDKPDAEDLRLANRENHLAWVGTRSDQIRLAGPMLSDDGEHMLGSMFILEADSIDAVRTFNADDPYTLAGLWGNVVVHPFRQVVPPVA
jgi:uncharacterized protein YciI